MRCEIPEYRTSAAVRRCVEGYYYRARMAEVMPPARTPKPIIANKGKEVLESVTGVPAAGEFVAP